MRFARLLPSRRAIIRRFCTETKKKKREPKKPERYQTGPPLQHYKESQRKWLFRFSLLCGASVLGLTGLGYSLPASFRLKTTPSPFSDERIRRRLQKGYWYFLGGMGIVFGIMAFVLNNPQARKTLYNYGSDTLMSGMLIVMFPTTQLLSAATTDEPGRQ